jgi:hypothetical protein
MVFLEDDVIQGIIHDVDGRFSNKLFRSLPIDQLLDNEMIGLAYRLTVLTIHLSQWLQTSDVSLDQ